MKLQYYNYDLFQYSCKMTLYTQTSIQYIILSQAVFRFYIGAYCPLFGNNKSNRMWRKGTFTLWI